MMEFLQRLTPSEGQSNLRQALRTFSMRNTGRGLAVLLSDFMDKDGFEEPLRYLVARQMDVYVIQVLSQEEVEPELLGDLRLIDVEDNDVTEVTANALLIKRYKENLAAYQEALKEFCSQRGIAYLFTTNQLPFEKLVLTYLRQRGLVR